METGNTKPIRVLVADDHPAARKGLQMLLAADPGIELVAVAANGREAVAKTMELAPDVVLMDMMMPELDGIGATIEIARHCPGTAVIVVTGLGNEAENAKTAYNAGAVGFILKDAREDRLIEAIEAAYQSLVHASRTDLPEGGRDGTSHLD